MEGRERVVSTTFGHVIQFASPDGKHWTDWFRHVIPDNEHARTLLKDLRKNFPNLIFKLITRETTVIGHEVNE